MGTQVFVGIDTAVCRFANPQLLTQPLLQGFPYVLAGQLTIARLHLISILWGGATLRGHPHSLPLTD